MEATEVSEVIGYHHLSLSVSAFEKVIEWYQQVLRSADSLRLEAAGVLVRSGLVSGRRRPRP